MTLLFTVNQSPATPAVAMFLLKTQLKAAGWTVPRSSDGTVYNSSGDQISSGSSGAGGMDNARAWFVIQQPGVTPRQFCCQRQNTTGAGTSQSWRIKYSKGAGFTGGSPAATVTPSATDEQILLGAGTDAAPSFVSMFVYTEAVTGLRFHCFASDAPPYGFMSWSWQAVSGLTGSAFGFEPLLDTAAEDTEPWITHLYGSPNSNVPWSKGQFYYGGASIHGWVGNTFYNNSGTIPVIGVGPAQLSLNITYDFWTTSRQNPITLNDQLYPLAAMAFPSSPTSPFYQWKGTLAYTRAIGPDRPTGTLYSVSSTRDTIIVGDCALPWDGISAPLL